MPHVNWKVRDYSKEPSGFRIATPTIDSTNIDDYIDPTTGYIRTLHDALNAVVIGTIEKTGLLVAEKVWATALPTDKAAQREIKAMVHYHDSVTGERYVFAVPCPDPQYLTANSDVFDLTNGGAWDTVRDILNAAYVSPDGNLMVVDEVKLVGRNI